MKFAILAAASAFALGAYAAGLERGIPLAELKSGAEFSGAEVRAMQADEFENPGMLWVTRGERLWREMVGAAGKSCASCHGDAATSMKGVAARYPRVDPGAARLVDLGGRINLCRVRNERAEPLVAESDDLLALEAYVAHQSRGMPMNITLDTQNAREFERGRALYYERRGQMNISCAQCHERNWGRKLAQETISQGHGVGYPTYRLEWQKLGSLQRRLRACYGGVRAAMPPYGARELVELELYLAWRAGNLPVEAPAVRR